MEAYESTTLSFEESRAYMFLITVTVLILLLLTFYVDEMEIDGADGHIRNNNNNNNERRNNENELEKLIDRIH